MIEPSDSEMATLSDVVRNYIYDLEAEIERLKGMLGLSA